MREQAKAVVNQLRKWQFENLESEPFTHPDYVEFCKIVEKIEKLNDAIEEYDSKYK